MSEQLAIKDRIRVQNPDRASAGRDGRRLLDCMEPVHADSDKRSEKLCSEPFGNRQRLQRLQYWCDMIVLSAAFNDESCKVLGKLELLSVSFHNPTRSVAEVQPRCQRSRHTAYVCQW